MQRDTKDMVRYRHRIQVKYRRERSLKYTPGEGSAGGGRHGASHPGQAQVGLY